MTLIHRHFWPDKPPYASILRTLAAHFVADGADVEVLTARPTYTEQMRMLAVPQGETIEGISVARLPVLTRPARLAAPVNLLGFPVQVAWRVLTGPRRDLVMCSTAPQISLGYAVSLAARVRRTPFIYHCMDLHPEIGAISGEFATPVVYRALSRLDLATMRRSARVVVLSEDMRRAVLARDSGLASRIVVLNNFSLPDHAGGQTEAASPLGPPADGVLRIVFTGNVGRFQGLDRVIRALSGATSAEPVELVVMGDGRARETLSTVTSAIPDASGLTVRFLPAGSVAQAKALMRTAHLGLVSLIPGVIKYAFPSKTMTYLEEGLPLLVVCEGESSLARDVRRHDLGYAVPMDDASGLLAAVRRARERVAERDAAQRWRDQVARWATSQVSEQLALDRWDDLVRSVTTSAPVQAARLTSRPNSPDESAPGAAPVIIVGAPRSGTNMLRDVLASLPGFATWPCDEINLMWKHGNLDVAHDELRRQDATPKVKRYLRKAFSRFARQAGADVIVEKTCATSLRVDFVDEVFPRARFVFIRRDGIDAAASSVRRWNAHFDLPYTLKKARYVPRADLPRHLGSFLGRRVRLKLSKDAGSVAGERNVQTWWGPKPSNFLDLQREYSLDEIAFLQWQRCVAASRRGLSRLHPARVHEVAYEDFVTDPSGELQRILAFLGRPDAFDPRAVASVKDGNIGKGRQQFGPSVVERLKRLSDGTLSELGYG
ncbi:MAG: sulfotransferase [Tetrasphaera sp.]